MAADAFIDLEAFRKAALVEKPFAYAMVPGFVKSDAIAAIEADFPKVELPGSFPLPTLKFGPAFEGFMAAITGPQLRWAVEQKFGMDLSARPTMVTVRGQSRASDGKIHIDSRTKLVTVLIYMNGKWEPQGGRLRLLRSQDDLNDVIAEVPPDEGTLLIFKNELNAWHGFEGFAGPRKVIQLNWVTSDRVVWWEQTRHKISAFFKSLRGR